MNILEEESHRQETSNKNGEVPHERLVPVKVSPSAKIATEQYNQQHQVKKTEDVTVHQIKIIKKRRSQDDDLGISARTAPQAIEFPPAQSYGIPVFHQPPSVAVLPEHSQNEPRIPATVRPQQTMRIQNPSTFPPRTSSAKKEALQKEKKFIPFQSHAAKAENIKILPLPTSKVKDQVPAQKITSVQPPQPIRVQKVTPSSSTPDRARIRPHSDIIVQHPQDFHVRKGDDFLSFSTPVNVSTPLWSRPGVEHLSAESARYNNATHLAPSAKPVISSVPVQTTSGNAEIRGMPSTFLGKSKSKEAVIERNVPIEVENKSKNENTSIKGKLEKYERSVPVQYLPNATVQDERYIEQEFKERQTLTIDRVRLVRTSKKKSLPMKVDITPKELSEAELSVQKKQPSPPRQRKAIVYRNEERPTEIFNPRKLERRASDSIIDRPSSRNANTQTLTRSFAYSSLRRRPHTTQPPNVAPGYFDAATIQRPNYPTVKVATVSERRVKSVSPSPLQLPVHIHRPPSASSESTLEPATPEPDFPTTKVVCPPQGRQIKSTAPTLFRAVTKEPSSSPPPVNRETQTSPAYPSSKIAGSPVLQIRTKSPSYLHTTYNSQKLFCSSPTSSISSWGTSELCRVDVYPLSPPDSSFGSWSSLPCPSLSSVTSQCDTDCLVIADARTGVIPDGFSDAETEELLEADPFARESKTEIYMGKPKLRKRLDPPQLKENDAAVNAASKSQPKKMQDVLLTSPSALDESATEHSIFETSQETVILNQELGKMAEEMTQLKEERNQPAQENVNNGCAQTYMSIYSLYVYPNND